MKGFIKKDFVVIKSNFKFLAIFIVIYCLLGASDISFLLPFLSIMVLISTFTYDNNNKWDAYSFTLPNGRKHSVQSKYLETIIVVLMVSLLTFLISVGMSLVHGGSLDMMNLALNTFGTMFGIFLMEIFMYPIIFKLGVEKARIGILVLIFALIFIFSFLSSIVDFTKVLAWLSFLENYWVLVIILITTILMFLSYKISLKIQLKKDF